MGLVSTAAPSPEMNFPVVRIDVPAKAVSQLNGIKPRKQVRVVLVGEVTEVLQREPDIDMPLRNVGALTLEVSKMEISKLDDAFGELLAEDD
jgi:hypothetical protein